MKAQELWSKINDKNADLLFYLRERWQDEKEYEDINDYLHRIQQDIPEAYKITKRPFGIVCRCSDVDLSVSVVSKGQYLQLVPKAIKK